jgi:dethiobiotin synthetase
VEQLLAASSIQAPRELVTPYAFAAAIAPHLAAAEEDRVIDLPSIVAAFSELREMADAIVVEGVGGFCVPLGPHCDTADLAVALDLPVILVVGLRLGCINHALLSQQAIAARGLRLVGWVANHVDRAMTHCEENLSALKQRLGAPLLAVVPFGTTPLQAACLLDLPD